MEYSFDFAVDKVNKLLICDSLGEISDIVVLEHMLKTIVKMAGKNQVKNIVLDETEFKIHCTNIEVAKLMLTIDENRWLSDLKIARIVKAELNIQNVIEGLAEKLDLSIKNFETRSEAMLWLLFNKEREKP